MCIQPIGVTGDSHSPGELYLLYASLLNKKSSRLGGMRGLKEAERLHRLRVADPDSTVMRSQLCGAT